MPNMLFLNSKGRSSLLEFVASTDNICEGFLEGGASNEESIDIGHGDELSCIFISDTATVENTGLLGSLCGNIFS